MIRFNCLHYEKGNIDIDGLRHYLGRHLIGRSPAARCRQFPAIARDFGLQGHSDRGRDRDGIAAGDDRRSVGGVDRHGIHL